MTASPAGPEHDGLVWVLNDIRGADTVALSLTIEESRESSAGLALGMDPLDARVRQVFFLDTPDLGLDAQGIAVCVRRIPGGGDATIAMRPAGPGELPEGLRRIPGFAVEVDMLPEGFTWVATTRAPVDSARVLAAAAEAFPRRWLFSLDQRRLFRRHAPRGLTLDDLLVLGPILVTRLRLAPEGFARGLVAQTWHLPDGARFLEISTECPQEDVFQVAAELRAFVSARAVRESGERMFMVRGALAHLVAQRAQTDRAHSMNPAASSL